MELKGILDKSNSSGEILTTKEHKPCAEFLEGKYADSELIIGLVGAVGTQLKYIADIIKERLKAYNYEPIDIRVSKDVIEKMWRDSLKHSSEYERICNYIQLGNIARELSKDNSILALGVATEIMRRREKDEYGNTKPKKRVAYIINSLKHPEEVERLREIYSNGFFLIGIHSDEERRQKFLVQDIRMKEEEAKKLIERDMDEDYGHGQHTRDTFHMSDFFVHLDNNNDKVKHSIWRILDLVFGHPFLTPTFDEFAMFMAFTSALRSADLSRQVGAIIARDNEIIASGANDCPKAEGGLYWPEFDGDTNEIVDKHKGRDYKRGVDSNKMEQAKIVDDILQCLGLGAEEKEKLAKSKIRDIIEYGRVVHAEMEAILMCARNNLSTRGATLYCTTFPCHNCAKHIIAAGIKRVVYVEPYPKSKAFDFHDDSICSKLLPGENKVEFVPFVGIGPRKFFDLFSMSLSSGYNLIRKDKKGYAVRWDSSIKGRLRCQMLPVSYLDREAMATYSFKEKSSEIKEKRGEVNE